MRLACERVLEIGHFWIETKDLEEKALSHCIPTDEFFDILRILAEMEYIKLRETFSGIPLFEILSNGFEGFAKANIYKYDSLQKDVIIQIVKEEKKSNKDIASSMDKPLVLIDHILEILEMQNLIHCAKFLGGNIGIISISPRLRRRLRD